MSFKGRSLLGLKDLTRTEIDRILSFASELADMKELGPYSTSLQGKTLLYAFYQPSTRTRMSHEAAMLRLGGKTMGFSNPSMTRAGDFYQESIKDTFRMLENYADVIVMRHYEIGAPHEAARWSNVPIINAGDGWGEHPTQVLTDLLTVRRRLGTLDGLNFLLVGDGRMRTMHSIGYALSNYDVKVSFACPKPLMITRDYLEQFEKRGLYIDFVDSVSKAIKTADVVYIEPVVQADYSLSRDGRREQPPSTPDAFTINNYKLETFGKPSAVVLHSLPRMDELSTDVDETHFAAYWEEARLGVSLKMALLLMIVGDIYSR